MDKEKFLADVAIDSESGRKVPDAVFDELASWDVVNKVVAMSFDTCAVNTGVHTGRLFF